MRIEKPFVEFVKIPDNFVLARIEKIARTCYKSEGIITDKSAEKFVSMLIKRGHEAMLEHECLSVRVICDRGISHEIVRHRIASYAQESTRYCNYNSEKFGGEITVISPFDSLFSTSEEYKIWRQSCEVAEKAYLDLIKNGIAPQCARSVLPTCLKTEIVVTMNLREWRHFFSLRLSTKAHPQMREIAQMILELFKQKVSVVFDDINIQET